MAHLYWPARLEAVTVATVASRKNGAIVAMANLPMAPNRSSVHQTWRTQPREFCGMSLCGVEGHRRFRCPRADIRAHIFILRCQRSAFARFSDALVLMGILTRNPRSCASRCGTRTKEESLKLAHTHGVPTSWLAEWPSHVETPGLNLLLPELTSERAALPQLSCRVS